jgi:uncharacterized membrane protein YgdD (TMEM256/DUF423 family)
MTATRLLLLAAGLMGATGVAFAALASHAYAGNEPLRRRDHAVAACARRHRRGDRPEGAGSSPTCPRASPPGASSPARRLFSADLALRTFAGTALFPMAAPIGGMMMIASWLGVSPSPAPSVAAAPD